MAQQVTGFRGTILREVLMRPALPPPRLAANVHETPDGAAFVVEIAVPGLEPDEISIEALGDTLTISTDPQSHPTEPSRRYVHREQRAIPMARIIEFPADIDPDHVEATLDAGILKVYAPKSGIGRRRVIRVGESAEDSGAPAR